MMAGDISDIGAEPLQNATVISKFNVNSGANWEREGQVARRPSGRAIVRPDWHAVSQAAGMGSTACPLPFSLCSEEQRESVIVSRLRPAVRPLIRDGAESCPLYWKLPARLSDCGAHVDVTLVMMPTHSAAPPANPGHCALPIPPSSGWLARREVFRFNIRASPRQTSASAHALQDKPGIKFDADRPAPRPRHP